MIEYYPATILLRQIVSPFSAGKAIARDIPSRDFIRQCTSWRNLSKRMDFPLNKITHIVII